jgi:RNA polymerase sigma factor (sigma-70 family)
MARDSAIPPESFDEILAWLNDDRDVAASIYLELRESLTNLFEINHCSDPQWLTDETIDRAARKVKEVRKDYKGDPRLYFYAIARNLIKEESKKIKKHASLADLDPPAPAIDETDDETAEMREACLRSCLKKLSAGKRKLIRSYYEKEKQAKIDHRAEMAQELGIKVETLRVSVHRIRNVLVDCIERCLARNAQRR